MKRLILCAYICLCGMSLMSEHLERFDGALPGTVSGWTKQGSGARYDGETLFDYIDGGAELYLSYGFLEVASFSYKKEGATEITVDVFDMGNSYNAYGVFSQSRQAIDARIGQGMEYAGGLLTFWKDRYYVSILAYPETAEAGDAVFRLARSLDFAMQGKGEIPAIVRMLPEEGLRAESVRYFRHYIWINSHYFISTENILDIDGDCGAVLAEYQKENQKYIVLLVRYPDKKRAVRAFAGFMKSYLPDADDNGAKEIEDGKWSGAVLSENFVIVVLNSHNKDNILYTINKLKNSIGRNGS